MAGSVSRRNPPRHATDRLHQERGRFTPAATAAKTALLERLLVKPPRSRSALVRLHDDLLFLRAFPDSHAIADLARRGLERATQWLHHHPAHRALDDTGTAWSTSRHTFPHAIACWLVQRYPSDVHIDWTAIPATAHLDALVRLLLTRAEEDAFEAEGLGTHKWMKLAVPPGTASDLAWLLTNGNSTAATRRTFAALYDANPPPIAWHLRDHAGSTTRTELAGIPSAFRASLRAPPPRPLACIASPFPLDRVALLPRRRARDVIDVARAALTARCREVFAISNPNPNEVWLADLGEGAALAIIGTEPSLRMSLEANYGYLLLSNGIPIGYGGVTALWKQANTGINIFEQFRGSEASYLWAQILRVFHTLFDVGCFIVNGYQFGEGNREAISSGAFWFYYRLGFRPATPRLRALAVREFRRLQQSPGARSSRDLLQQLAHGDLRLTLPGFQPATFVDEPLLQLYARRVTERLAAADAPNRERSREACSARVRKALNIRSVAGWPAPERAAFDRLAPVLDLIPSLSYWTASEKRALVAMARAKGVRQEREFVRLAQKHPRFWPELLRVSGSRAGTRRR